MCAEAETMISAPGYPFGSQRIDCHLEISELVKRLKVSIRRLIYLLFCNESFLLKNNHRYIIHCMSRLGLVFHLRGVIFRALSWFCSKAFMYFYPSIVYCDIQGFALVLFTDFPPFYAGSSFGEGQGNICSSDF